MFFFNPNQVVLITNPNCVTSLPEPNQDQTKFHHNMLCLHVTKENSEMVSPKVMVMLQMFLHCSTNQDCVSDPNKVASEN